MALAWIFTLGLSSLGLSSIARGQDSPRTVKHPKGDLWLLVPQGWSSSVDAQGTRLELTARGGALSVTVVAFPSSPSNTEILDAVKDKFGRLATQGGAAAIAWETSALAIPPSADFTGLGRSAAFVRRGHPLKLEVYLLRGAASVFAFAVVADAFSTQDHADALRDLLRHARASEAGAAAVVSESLDRGGSQAEGVAPLGSRVELPRRQFHLRVPPAFEVEVEGPELLLHAPSGRATLVAAYRETPLEPAAFLASIRAEYATSLKSSLGVDPSAIVWSEPEAIKARDFTGVRAHLVVSVARDDHEPVRIEQRFYVLAAPVGVLFFTGSAEEGSTELADFERIAGSVEGKGEPR